MGGGREGKGHIAPLVRLFLRARRVIHPFSPKRSQIPGSHDVTFKYIFIVIKQEKKNLANMSISLINQSGRKLLLSARQHQ